MNTKTNTKSKIQWLSISVVENLLKAWEYATIKVSSDFNKRTAAGCLVRNDFSHHGSSMPCVTVQFFQPLAIGLIYSKHDKNVLKSSQLAIAKTVGKNIAESFRFCGYRATVSREDGSVSIRMPANYNN